MVQSYQSPVRVYKYPFEMVMAAYERRFPICELIPVFISSDILYEYRSEDGAEVVIERRCKLNLEVPYLLKKIVGVDYVNFIQKNSLDLRSRVLKIEAYNESFSSRIEVKECCTYFVHPENKDWTCFEQSATLDVKSFFGFENSVEKLAIKHYSQNIKKGKEIIEHFVSELKKEGIHYVPQWKNPAMNDKAGGVCQAVRERSSTNESISSEELKLGASASTLSQKLEKSSLAKDSQYQLEADYIQRYLGHLSPLQESRLVQLRKWVGELQKGKVPSDAMLLRFLQARDYNLEKAREMLSQSIMWRKKYQVDKILSEYETPIVIKDYFPGGWHYHDKEGRPLYLLRLGQMDVKGLIRSIGEEGMLKLTLHVCEEGLHLTEEATHKTGTPITTWTLLIDLEGLNMRHLWRPGIRALLHIIEIVEANYPETMGRVLIVRAPRVFPILWTLVGTFIDETTRSKFIFLGGSDYKAPSSLAEYVGKEYVPDFLGGPCRRKTLGALGTVPQSLYAYEYPEEAAGRSTVLEGGTVPKTHYMSEEEYEKEKNEGSTLCEDSIYHSVSLSKGQVHEVLIINEDPGSVITWDFDILRQDVIFTVLRTRVPIRELQTPTGALQTIQNMNPLATDPEHKSFIEKGWREGQDYYRVESAIICHDGESIQGSHVTSHVGTYILQWKFHDTAHCHNPLDLIDSITSPKAKVMYFFETLSSADYKGSMSSLQSAQSGLSSTTSCSRHSAASSCPSR